MTWATLRQRTDSARTLRLTSHPRQTVRHSHASLSQVMKEASSNAPARLRRQRARLMLWQLAPLAVLLHLLLPVAWQAPVGPAPEGRVSEPPGVPGLNIFFVNQSTWGPTADCFMESRRQGPHHSICFAEHHLAGARLAKVKNMMPAWGRRGFASQATAIGRADGGTSGGVMIAPRLSLTLSYVPAERGQQAAVE